MSEALRTPDTSHRVSASPRRTAKTNADLRATLRAINSGPGVVDLSRRLMSRLESLEARAGRATAIDFVKEASIARVRELGDLDRGPLPASFFTNQIESAATDSKRRARA